MNILKSFLLLHLITRCYSETRIYQNFFGSFDIDWSISDYYNCRSSTCQSRTILGGYNCFDGRVHIVKTFELTPHYKLRIKFLFWRIDHWNGHRFKVYVDNIEKHNQQYYHTSSINELCGSTSHKDETFTLDLYAYHQSPTAQILITGENWWGISDVELFIEECRDGCDSCDYNGCFNQILYIQYFTAKSFTYVDFNEGWQSENGIFDNKLVNIRDYTVHHLQTWISTKTINLADHDAVSISLKIITMNYNHYVDILIDDVLVIASYVSLQVYLFLNSDYNYLIINQINIQSYRHKQNSMTLTIRMAPSSSLSSYSTYLGIRDFQLFIRPNQKDDYCFDGNIYPFDGCFAKIYDCVEGCANCVRGVCLQCYQGWQYYEQNKNCLPICGDSIITYFEECDDGNTYQYDGCYQCKYSCPLNCSDCQFGKCQQCQPRYKLIYGQCKYICDGSESYEEQENRSCYNSINNLIDNGHYQHNIFNNLNYKYQLVSSLTCNLQDYGIFGYFYNLCSIPMLQHCKESHIDKCLECDQFYELKNNKSTCIPICNDGIVIEQELCDDQNNIQFDGCYKCQQSCLLECLNCIGNKCYQCIDGWQLIDYSCYQYCGDGKVAKTSMEQCDDGNYNDGDGCFQCKFECFQYCQFCADRNTCLVCEQYFELYKNYCIPICGDKNIVIGLEECEDGNNIPYDGCFNCMFQCEKECQTCISGLCVECIEGYIITKDYCQINNQTHIIDDEEVTIIQNKCGDAIYSNDEECDDGNIFNGDGCSSLCVNEPNWYCNNKLNQPSICSPNTVFKLSPLNQTQSIQYVQLSFSNQVKLSENITNFTNSINHTIQSVQQDLYVITIIPVTEIDQTILRDANYVFKIQIFTSITTSIFLDVEINANLEDQNKQNVNTTLQTIKLQLPKVLNQNQLQTANNFQSLGHWMLIGLASSSFFLFLFGNPSQCMEILDTLQFQSYLKFINVEFPQNILIYFQSSEIVTINPILINLKVNDFFGELLGYQYLESVGKLFEYQLNADLLVNIQGQFTQIGFLIGLFIFIKYFTRFIYTKCFGNKYFYYIRLMNNKIIESIGLKFYYLNKNICKINDNFNMQGFIQLFHANSWDLIFKILMYLTSNYQLGLREIGSHIISIGYLISIIIIVSRNFKGYNRKIILKDLRTQQHDDIILLKKLFFLVVLIIGQSYPLMQCILLTCILFLYLGSIISIDFAINKFDLLIIIWMEAPVMIFTLSCMIFSSDFQKYFSTDQQIIAGFIQISLLVLALLSPLVRCGYQFYGKGTYHTECQKYIRGSQK